MALDRTLLWHPPSGPPLNLTDPANGIFVRWNLTGFMAPTYRVSTKRSPGQAGSRIQAITAVDRELEVGLVVSARTSVEFLHRARQLVRAMQPASGSGRLEVIRSDGTARSIECVCTEGLEGAETPGTGGMNWWHLDLSFLAPQPYARMEPITVPWSLAPSGRGWFPIIPIRLGASGIAGRKTVNNPGDVEAFPVIAVRGPGSGLIVRHRGTGRAAHLDYTIPESGNGPVPLPEGVVTIDTRRGAQSITDGYGVNLFEHLTDDDPSLFPLLPGDNDIEVELQAAAPSSSVSLTFDPLYESL